MHFNFNWILAVLYTLSSTAGVVRKLPAVTSRDHQPSEEAEEEEEEEDEQVDGREEICSLQSPSASYLQSIKSKAGRLIHVDSLTS